MGILNLLAESSQNFIDFSVEGIASVDLNWIGKIISWIFDLFTGMYGGVALGVVLFTLMLKTLVLPLDIYSRVKTKKQSLVMEKMRPQMEKLQKQYANDKNMYSQKVMELQKANGYSPLGACLPMIISLVIFMVVFSAFSTYSNYATLVTYNDLVNAYNGSVVTYIIQGENDTEASHFLICEGEYDSEKYETFEEYYGAEKPSLRVNFDKFKTYYPTVKSNFDVANFDSKTESEKIEVVAEYVQLNARATAAKHYRDNKDETTFLWIGNLWYPDSMLNKEVPDFSKFSSAISRASGGMTATYEESYNEVTFDLGQPDPDNPNKKPETRRYNGYFVLILLAIGFMFLQQFIMMRSQKAANELSSVDGSAARTNKWMMILMPIIFGIFSFFYSAAFSIYMIINTVYGLVSMLIINKIVTVRFAKNELKGNNRAQKRKRLK